MALYGTGCLSPDMRRGMQIVEGDGVGGEEGLELRSLVFAEGGEGYEGVGFNNAEQTWNGDTADIAEQ